MKNGYLLFIIGQSTVIWNIQPVISYYHSLFPNMSCFLCTWACLTVSLRAFVCCRCWSKWGCAKESFYSYGPPEAPRSGPRERLEAVSTSCTVVLYGTQLQTLYAREHSQAQPHTCTHKTYILLSTFLCFHSQVYPQNEKVGIIIILLLSFNIKMYIFNCNEYLNVVSSAWSSNVHLQYNTNWSNDIQCSM